MEARTPVEILAYASDVGVGKAQRNVSAMLILSFFAGAFIAFASGVSNMAAYNLLAEASTYGLGRALSGALFGSGLMLVIIAGGELFTGNMLIIISVMDRRVAVRRMLWNWLWVYIGNFVGAVFVAWLMYHSDLFNSSGGLLGGVTINMASYKTAISFQAAFILGLLCNWLVCLIVWAAYAAKDVAGKVLVIFFLIWLFATSGFEHSVANMYYIPAGIFAKQNPAWLSMSYLPAEQLAGLTWGSFFVKNLIPVTLGNIIGGACMVGVLYWFPLRKQMVERRKEDRRKG